MGKKLIHFLRVAATSALSSPRSFSTSSASDDDASSSVAPSASSSPSPWAAYLLPGLGAHSSSGAATGLIASLAKADGGKVYSLAAAGDALYTGTDSETVRVWRDRRELGGFRTGSGLVKAIVVAADGRVFTGHQDGKVRVWQRRCGEDSTTVRVGSLPALGDYLASSVNPARYVDAPARGRRRRRAVWNRHSDAVSCLGLDEGAGLLYSASWDRTFKAWRLSDSRCLDSVPAHDDAVNAVAAAGFGGLVLSGSADGTFKVWRRQQVVDHHHQKGDRIKHVLDRVLRKGEGAVTAIAACSEARAAYVGSSDGLVACWRWVGGDGEEPVLRGVLAGHDDSGIMCLAVSGPVVVSGAADGTLCVWRRDGAEHLKLAVLAGHAGPVKCVAVAREQEDNRQFVVYSGSLDGSVKVWRLSDERAPVDYSPGTTGAQACGSRLMKTTEALHRQQPVQACTNNVYSRRCT
jgi:WD40 repeat protein